MAEFKNKICFYLNFLFGGQILSDWLRKRGTCCNEREGFIEGSPLAKSSSASSPSIPGYCWGWGDERLDKIPLKN